MTTKISKCVVCNLEFPSRNKLFAHLRDSDHGGASATNIVEKGGRERNDNRPGSSRDCDVAPSPPSSAEGNDAYREYYLRQKICNRHDDDDVANEREWEESYRRLRTPLPVSYRVHESSPIGDFGARLLERLADDDGREDDDGVDGTAGKANPGGFLRWSFDDADDRWEADGTGTRMVVAPRIRRRKKSGGGRSKGDGREDGESDVLSSVMHALQELGAIHRQELVSAIPPIVLMTAGATEKGGRGSLIIADLCAAPGSKSLQLLDMLHARDADRGSVKVPSGLLAVNDSDRNRIVTLCQRSRRVPRAPLLAVNVDARYFPGMRRRRKSVDGEGRDDDGAVATTCNEKAGYKQKYDGVLCDVPCSGDGTVRKCPRAWSGWSVAHAMSLHRLQRKILRRAMELLRPGGVVVYSTCSLNPLEDEAVVASAIGDVGGAGAMEVVPLPEGLARKCRGMGGLSEWRVPHPGYGKQGVRDMYENFHDVPTDHQGGGEINEGKKKKKGGGRVNPSMFPPEKGTELARQLVNCGRFLPNADLDSGGFFVACIRRLRAGELGGKTKALRDDTRNAPDETDEAASAPASVPKQGEEESSGDEKSKPTPATVPAADEQCLREGDWICTLCKKVNFGRRGGTRCFGCKARRHHSTRKDGEDEVARRPLLVRPKRSELESFLDFFGVATGPGCPFPLENARVLCRAKAKECTIVIVSEALSKLAISESWSPVRELGTTLAAFPKQDRDGNDGSKPPAFRLLDEGAHLFARCATRRHLRLRPLAFRNALAQSVRAALLAGPAAEAERVAATLGGSEAQVDSLCEDVAWHDLLEEQLLEEWAACKASPGFFVVSCECGFPIEEGGTGRFTFVGGVDDMGNVEVKTSLRVLAAMLVVVHKYSEVALLSNDGHPRLAKRRRR